MDSIHQPGPTFINALTYPLPRPLFLLTQAIQAGQVTVEDHLMSDLDIQPLLVVGWEGVIGSIVMLGGALPLLQHLPYRDGSGFAEDTMGSLCMIRNSKAIAGEHLSRVSRCESGESHFLGQDPPAPATSIEASVCTGAVGSSCMIRNSS